MLRGIFLILTLLILQANAFDETEQVNMDQPINVSGKYSKPMTEADKLKVLRKKYEKRNEIYAQQKIEQWRLKQELDRQKKLKAIFDAQLKALDNL